MHPQEKERFISINRPWIDTKEKEEILSVISEESLTSAAYDGGKRVRSFENLLKNYVNCKHAIAVNSGTSALYSSLLSLDVRAGDEVLLPSFTFVATANSVVALGAKPVFVDIDMDTYTIDPRDLEKKITEKSRAVIPVHLYGHPANIDEVVEVAQKNSLSVIEDACQSLGSKHGNRHTGTIGDIGCISLYASKVVTSGEGGAIVTNNDDLADKVRMIRNHGMVKGYDSQVFGLNLRLPEVCAAMAVTQMGKLTTILQRRRDNARQLSENLSEIEKDSLVELILPRESNKLVFNWYLYTIRLSHKKLKNIRDIVKNNLINDGIGATVYYDPPVHNTPYYQSLSHFDSSFAEFRLDNTEIASKSVLSLPVHPLLEEEDINRICHSLKKAIKIDK